jgi:hypothetical protein
VVRVLLEHNADVNINNACGETPLHVACQYHMLNMARLLLSFGADITLTDRNSKTSLDYADEAEERQLKQQLYEFAQRCPAECWRRRRELILLQYSKPASSSTAATTL